MKRMFIGALFALMVVGGAVFLRIPASFASPIERAPFYAQMESVFANEEDYLEEGADGQHAADSANISNDTGNISHSIANTASATSSPRSVRIPVLIYHSVRPYIPGESAYQDAYDITPELFARELRYLNENGYVTITFADVVAYFEHGAPLPPHPVILSFDDGWRNQYTYAFPLLQQYGMKGTFFIFTNPIDRAKPHWMSWDEIRTLDAAGMEIAGHSRTHPVLTQITSDAALDKEIAGGKEIIEKELGHPIRIFAYPFGAMNERVVAAVARAGYVLARTTYSGVWNDPEHALAFHGTIASDKWSDLLQLLHKP